MIKWGLWIKVIFWTLIEIFISNGLLNSNKPTIIFYNFPAIKMKKIRLHLQPYNEFITCVTNLYWILITQNGFNVSSFDFFITTVKWFQPLQRKNLDSIHLDCMIAHLFNIAINTTSLWKWNWSEKIFSVDRYVRSIIIAI